MKNIGKRDMTPEVRDLYDSAFMAGHSEFMSSGISKANSTVDFLRKAGKLRKAMGLRVSMDKFIDQLRREIENDDGMDVQPMSLEQIIALAATGKPKLATHLPPPDVQAMDERLAAEDLLFLIEEPMISAPLLVENTFDEMSRIIPNFIEAHGVDALAKTLKEAPLGSTVVLSQFTPSRLTISNAELLTRIADAVFSSKGDKAPSSADIMSGFADDEKELIEENMPTMRAFTTLHAALDLGFRQQCVLIIPCVVPLTPVLYNRMVALGRVAI